MVGAPLQAALIDQWEADDVAGLGDGVNVATWLSTGGRTVGDGIGGAARQPVVELGAFGTHAGVTFSGGGSVGAEGSFLRSPSTGAPELNNPLSGVADYSIVLVYRADTTGVHIANQWWGHAGIVDSGKGGGQEEWGIGITDVGGISAGHGGTSSDVTANGGTNTVTSSPADATGHVAIMTQSAGSVRLYIDGGIDGQVHGGSTAARRDDGTMTFGCLNDAIFGVAPGGFARCFNGSIASVGFYDTQLSPAEVVTATTALAGTYGVAPEPATMTLLALGFGGMAAARRRRRQ
jgi:hypothetical protein